MTVRQSDPTATEDSVIAEVVSVVSRAEGIDETDLTPPLGEVIDTDALVEFVASATVPASATFTYRGREVEVHGGDDVEVTVHHDGE